MINFALVVKLDIILGFEPRVPGSSPGEGTKEFKTKNYMTKKIALFLIIFIFFLIPLSSMAFQIVPCQNNCTIGDLFTMLNNIYTFVVTYIAAPLATIALIIGGIIMLTSAGNPSQFQKGKQILVFAIIGLILAFGSHLIIKTLLNALGYIY